MTPIRITGGCQCGAVRYALHEQPTGPSICHCRMCQKAFGSFFAPLDRRCRRQVRADPRRARDRSAARIWSSGASAATAARRSPSAISTSRGSASRSARSTSRRRSRRCSQYGIEARMPWFDDAGGAARRCDDRGRRARPRRGDRRDQPPASRSRHGRMAPAEDRARPRGGTVMAEPRLTGGCQCGAVRYAIHETPYQVGVCHCRMCQKAVGAPYFATFTVKKTSIEWTRGKPAVFNSSAKMERGFCRDCGTPLYNNWMPNEVIHPAIATLDEPSALTPEFQVGVEARLAWTNDVPDLKALEHRRHLQGLRGAARRDRGHQPPASRPRYGGLAAGRANVTEIRFSGGCQCGAVRFRAEAPRPCRRSAIAACARRRSAAFYGPFVTGHRRDLDARRSRSVSVPRAASLRGFCGDCGTPLTFETRRVARTCHRRLRRSDACRAGSSGQSR